MSCPPMHSNTIHPAMGPNLVFNFHQSPYNAPSMYAPPPQAGGGGGGGGGGDKKKEEEGRKKPVLVQGNPTWNDPRMLAPKGKPIKNNGCLIQ
ncbi:hypothetical protein BD560DRAFT_323630 [Blakeslea trispora]|nr:hypothetical protein BD560DRAFT_323630 [Blakeslea trispora]